MYQYEYKTLHELMDAAATHNLSLSEVVVRHEMETSEQTEEAVRSRMEGRLAVFKESIDAGLNDTEKSVSGLVGGDADKLLKAAPKLLGPLAKKAAVYALAVSEANAKMFKNRRLPDGRVLRHRAGRHDSRSRRAGRRYGNERQRPVYGCRRRAVVSRNASSGRRCRRLSGPNAVRLPLWLPPQLLKWPAGRTIRYCRPSPSA